MLSSVAKLWPANFGHLGFDWLLGIFRHLHVTFLQILTSSGNGRQQLDENGNPLKSGDLSSNSTPVRDPKVSDAVEGRVPPVPTYSDGKARRGGKETTKKGKSTGKSSVQIKTKAQKAKKNETGTGCGKNSDFGSRRRVGDETESSLEPGVETKNVEEEEHFEDCDDDDEAVATTIDDQEVEDRCEAIETKSEIEDTRDILPCRINDGSEIPDNAGSTLSPAAIEQVALTGRNRTRKKRRKGKNAKCATDTLVSATATKTNRLRDDLICGDSVDHLIGKSSDVPLSPVSCVVTLPPRNSTMFGGNATGNSHQKPSARVHPSRSISMVDCALNSPPDNDSSPELKDSGIEILSVDSKNGDLKLCDASAEHYPSSLSILSCVDFVGGFKTTETEVGFVHSAAVSSDPKSCSGRTETSTTSEDRRSSRFNAPSSCEFHNCPPTLSRTKPQSLVNPFSTSDSSVTSRSPRADFRSVEVNPEPASLRPRSLVNPLPTPTLLIKTKENSAVEPAVALRTTVDFHVPRTTRSVDSRVVVNGASKNSIVLDESWSTSGVSCADGNSRQFSRSSSRSDSLSSVDGSGQIVADNISSVCHGSGFRGNHESSHSVVPFFRCKNNEGCAVSDPVHTARQLGSGRRRVCAKQTPDRDSVLFSDPTRFSSPSVRRDLGNSKVREVDSFGRRTTGRPRNVGRGGKGTLFRTSSFRTNAVQADDWRESHQTNFDLWRARQFLHAEFLSIVNKQKQNCCEVVVFKGY